MEPLRLVASALLACSLAGQAAAHVTLRYPLPTIQNDFLDNVRTNGLCGDGPQGEGMAWIMPEANASAVETTNLTPGQPLNVSWDLHYAHQGGFKLELYDADMALKHEWSSEDHWGCSVDSTVQEVTVTLPSEACVGCTLRLTRQALEWGAGYLFKSCAKVDIGPSGDACQGCSGHGTCGAGGACTCNSSPAMGFYYGTHCEYENECEEDTHCGANGKCINIGDVSGPAKQCFCEAGFFGDVVKRPSGMEVRTCTRESSYTVPAAATYANFVDMYNATWTSPGDTFQAGVAVMGDDVEVAMVAKTTSWVAFGLRAMSAAGDGGGKAAGESEPKAEGEEAEGEYPKAAGEPEAEGEAEGEYPKPAGAPKAEGEPAAEAEASSTPAPAAEAEAGSRRRLASAEAPAPAAEGEGAAAEGEGAGGSTCAMQTDVYVPGQLGTGAPANGTAGGTAAAEGEATPAAEDTAPAAEGAARRRQMLSMPVVESEGPSIGRRGGAFRNLLQAAAEGEDAAEGEGAAEGEAGGAAAKPYTIADGPCAGFKTTPPGTHPMANQDIVFGAAREVAGTQYFRIVDMFTPSRAKPLPDHEFCYEGVCGGDSIEDAIGMEVDGVSYFIIKRKAVPATVSLSDTCIAAGQTYQLIYAYGQLTATASHQPDSALEIIPDNQKSNSDFYQVDELKYHGGGIGVTYDGRGTLAQAVDLLAEPAAPGAACTPSTEDGFECMQSELAGAVIIHYNTRADGDTSATLAIETPSAEGYVAIGWPETPGQMIGATAVIATTSAENGIGVYDLTAKAVPGVTEVAGATTLAARRRLSQAGGVEITDASVERAGGRTIATFTRAYDDTFTGEGEMDMICSHHATSSDLAYHTGREAFKLSLEAAAPAAAAAAAPAAAAAATDATTPAAAETGAAPAGRTAAATVVAAFAVAAAMLL